MSLACNRNCRSFGDCICASTMSENCRRWAHCSVDICCEGCILNGLHSRGRRWRVHRLRSGDSSMDTRWIRNSSRITFDDHNSAGGEAGVDIYRPFNHRPNHAEAFHWQRHGAKQ
jgi:hypothetical protein